jgi:hypothetical protein
MAESSDLSFQEVLLECLKSVEPDSERIPSLDRRVLDLKIEDIFDEEILDSSTAIQPVVHGIDR